MSTPPPLMSLLQFTSADLDANRQGHLTSNQKRCLRRQCLTGRQMLHAVLLTLFVVAIIGGIVAEINAEDWIVSLSLALLLLGTLGVVFGGLGLRAWREVRREWLALRADLDAGSVASASGSVQMELIDGHPPRCYLHVAGQRFEIPEKAAFVFDQHQPYTVYYAPRLGRLLSVETAG